MKTKRRSRWSRILAIVLAMTMVLCDQSVLYASDSMADPVAEEVVTEPIAEEPAPQAAEAPAAEVAEPQPAAETPATEAPKAETPATEAPVTEAPKAEAPATEAPATEAPATEAPATEAPKAEAPATEAPATEAPKAEAPATEAPATEAPKAETPATEAPATEAPQRKNLVTFQVGEGAAVWVKDAAEASTTGTAVDGKILFTIRLNEGYTLESVLVDGTTPARQTETGEYIIEGIQTDNTIVTVKTKAPETEAPTEPAPAPAEEPAEPAEEPASVEEPQKTYTIVINHMLTTSIGRFSTVSDPIQITEQDLTDGVFDISGYALSRDGLVVSKAYNLTKAALEQFGGETVTATIKYKVADGWIVIPNDEASQESSFRGVYIGSLDNVTIVPAGQLPITFQFLYENGTIARHSETRMFTQQDGGNYEVSYTIEDIPAGYGFEIDNAKFTVDGNVLHASYGKDEKEDSVTITFKANTVAYQVTERVPNKGYEEADLSNPASYTDTPLTTSFTGKVGDTTAVNAAEKNGFTAKPVEQQEIAADGSTQVIVEYIRNTYAVKYDTDGGSYKAAKEGLYESEITIADGQNPTKAGYTFAGWYMGKAANAEKAADRIASLEQDLTVYAHWNADTVKYTVVYQKENLSGGYDFVKSVTRSAKTGTKVSGRDDAGSFTDSAYYHFASADQNVEVKADNSTVVYVKYKLNTYKIEFNLNKKQSSGVKLTIGGNTYSAGGTKYYFEARLGEDISAKWPTKTNISGANNFHGWDPPHSNTTFVSKRFNLTKNMIADSKNNSTTTYKALWENGWTVELHYRLQNADDNEYTDDSNYRQSAISSGNFTAKEIDGYTNEPEKDYYKDGHYYFHYKRNTYTISYYYKDRNLESKTGIRFGKNINTATYKAPADKAKCGVDSEYVFDGWYDNPNGYGDPYSFTTMPSHNLALYAKWVAPDKKVTLVYNNGEANGEIVTQKGNTITVPDPERTGFDFAGWYTDEGFTTKFDVNAPVTKDITIYAKWKARRFADYTVKYETADGKEVAASKTKRGQIGSTVTEKAVAPTDAAYQGYAVDAPTKSLKITGDPEKDVIKFVYASPAELEYKVQYVYGGTVLKDTGFKKASAAEFREYPDQEIVKELNAQGYRLKNQYQMVKLVADNSQNIVTFELELSSYQIKYVLNGGTNDSSNPDSYTIKDLPLTIKKPAREGYIFAGWEYSGTLKEGTHDPRAVVLEKGTVGNLTFTAKWLKVTSYEGPYDGNAHSISTEGVGGTILYSVDQSNWTTENPSYVDVSSNADQKYPVYVKLSVKEQNWESEVIPAYVKITPRQVTFTGETGSKPYNGELQTLTGVTAEGLLDNHTHNVTAKAEGTDAGEYKGTITAAEDVQILADEQDVTKNYEITTVPGTLTITQKTDELTVTITGNSDTVGYDGKSHEITDFTTDAPESVTVALNKGKEAKASGTDAGIYPMGLTAEDFTATSLNYSTIKVVVEKDGSLTISPRPVTLTSASGSKVYDGTPLTKPEVTVGGDGFVDGEATAKATGSVTNVSDSPAINSIEIEKTEAYKDSNYQIKKNEGELSITPVTDEVTVTITENSGSAKYDGIEHSATGYVVKSISNLLYKETDFTFNGNAKVKGTDAGSYDMELKAENFTNNNANFAKVTFEIEDGKLTISPRQVTLTSETASKAYDGTALTRPNVTITGDGFVKGEATAKATGSALKAGESVTNTIEIIEGEGYKEGNYTITEVPGTLTVTASKKAIVITASSNSWPYNGSAHSDGSYTVTYDGTEIKANAEGKYILPTGDEVTAVVTGSVTNVEDTVAGNNKITKYAVANAGNYNSIQTVNGTLTITPRSVKLSSETASKVYDGTPLTKPKVTITGDGFVKGEATAKATGSVTYVSESPVTNAIKIEKTETYKDSNYQIEKNEGKLTITPVTDEVTVTITEHSGTETYDGTEHSVTGYDVTKISNSLYKASDFTFNGKAEVKGIDAGSYNMELKAEDFTNNNTNFTKVTFKIEDGKLTISPRPVTLTSETASKIYDGTPLTKPEVAITGEGFVKGEATAKATGSVTYVSESPVTNTIKIEKAEAYKDSNYQITTNEGKLSITPVTDEVTVTITEHSGTETYDGTEHTVTGYVVKSISNTLYKASDFTFNGNAEVKATDAGSYDMELKAEDFTNNNTNFANVTFKIEDGKLTISPRQVTLTSASDSKVYDGTALTSPNVTVGGDGFVKGEATAKATGSVTNVSESPAPNTIEIEKTEAYKDSNYQIEMSEGELSITPVTDKVTVTITENSGSAKYDGIEHSATGYVVKSISNPLYKETDFTFSGNAEVKGTDAGSYDMELKAEDFTNNNTNFANVTFEIEDGTLTISPRQVTLTSASDSKAYDGTPLTSPEVAITGDGFVAGEATAKATGSALKAGESVTNTIEIVEGEGYKEGNYTITKLPGTLTVTASEKAIVITAASNRWMYDGSAHSDGSYTVTYDGAEIAANEEGKYILPTGDEVTAVVTGSVTNVEDTVAGNNEITEYAVENAGNYNSIQTVNGTLEITPRPVTLTSETGSKVYDGTPLTKPEVTVGGEGFVEGEATAKAIGSVTYVSESPVTNTIKIEKTEAYKDSNYQIKKNEGKLTITPVTDEVTVTITERNGSAKYDGIEHTVTGYDVSISNPLYKETDFTFSGNAEVKGTDAGSYDMELKAEDFTNNNTNFANVTFEIEDGTLTISKRQVTLTSASDSKAYDGTALTNQEVTVGGDGFAEGEGASYDVTGSQTYVGSSKNTFTYTLNGSTVKRSRMLKAKAATPETKASNYVITKEYGTLTVTDENVTGVVTKTHEGEKYNLNDTVTFKITVQNIYAEAQNITITEQPGVTITGESRFTNVQPGEFVETTATYTITEEDILRGEFGNTATAIFSNGKEYTGTDEVIPDDPNPHLTVEKTTTSSPANGKSYALGETISYQITVKNDGNLTIKDIEVTDELTGNTGDKAWKIEELAPGAEKTFTTSYTVTEKDILAGSVVNKATAKGTSPDPEKPDVPVEPGKKEDPTDPAKTSLQVVKTTISEPANGETYALGETIEYRITVTNTGNLTVEDVKVLDELTGNIGDQALVVEEPLAPGKKAEFNVSYTVTEKDILAGSVVNEATATGTSTNPDNPEVPVIPGKTEDPTDPANGHLVITKSTISEPANGKAYALGETITYKIIVKNDGNLTIKDIEVTDELTGNIGDKAWKIEELAPGKLEEFTTSYTVTEKDILAGSVVNEATAKGTSPDPEKPDVPVKPGEKEDPTDPANGHLNITKTTTSTPANGSAYALGETITYQITVKNDGNLTIKDIEVTDELTGNIGDKAWKIDSLSPDESKVFTAEYKVTEADILKGEVHNEATAKGKNPDPEKPEVPVDPGTKDEPTVKAAPSLFVDKEANQKAGGYALGEEISYTIRVLNNGNVTISNITVTDEMTGLNETIPTLAVGEEKTFTTTHKVTEADILKGKILNVATAKGTDPKGNPVEKDDTKEIDTEPKNAHVTLEKETTSTPADGKAYVIGEKITYQITVTNDGNLTAANLVVTDELTGNSGENAWKIESLAPGESKVFTAEYTVTEADAQAGKVVNTAAASGTSPDPEKPELPTTPGTKEVPTQDNSGTIQITKNLTLDGESVTAKDVTFYVALFEDEACTVRLTEAKGLTFNGTSAATVTFDHMLVGKTYYVSETDGNGNVVTNGSINGTPYMADFSEGRSVTVSETNGSASLTFTNVFGKLPSNRFYKDARLTLTKKVLDADGKAKKSNETFYIGLFADAAHSQLTDRTTENVIALDMNGASESAAKTINIVISADTPATFYIAEVDKNGNPVGKDFAYEATVDLPEVTLSETNSNVSVVITNQEKAEEPTETEEPTAKTTEKPADKTTKAPKTGDNTNIWLYVTLMMLSALTGSGYAVRRRRKNRKAR